MRVPLGHRENNAVCVQGQVVRLYSQEVTESRADGRRREDHRRLAQALGSERSGVRVVGLDEDGLNVRRYVGDGRKPIVVEVAVDDDSQVVRPEVLRQGVADALHNTSLDLAACADGVDDPADIMDSDEVEDVDASGLFVQGDLHAVAVEGGLTQSEEAGALQV